MKNMIKVAVVVMVAMVGAATLSAQTPKQTAPAKETPKTEAAPCKAGEVLKDAKKPFDAKTNPCVKAPVKK